MSWLIWSLWTIFLYLLTSGPPGFAATATIGHPENLVVSNVFCIFFFIYKQNNEAYTIIHGSIYTNIREK